MIKKLGLLVLAGSLLAVRNTNTMEKAMIGAILGEIAFGTWISYKTLKLKRHNELIKLNTSLCEACKAGDREQVVALLSPGILAEIDEGTESWSKPLHYAAEYNHLEIAQLLVNNGACINAHGINHCTPLYQAVDKNHVEMARYLLENGANVNCVAYDSTPLHVAIRDNSQEMIDLLIDYGACINGHVRLFGETPLHIAAWRNKKVAQRLIALGASLGTQDKKGNTPLHVLVEYNDRFDSVMSDSFFAPMWKPLSRDRKASLKKHCLVYMLKDLGNYDFLKNNDFLCQQLSTDLIADQADFIADQVPLAKQQELASYWRQAGYQQQVTSLLRAHYERHFAKMKRTLLIQNNKGRTVADAARRGIYPLIAQRIDDITKAQQFDDLKKEYKHTIIANVSQRLLGGVD